MSPKAKNKSFPPVKVTEEFLEETKKQAELVDEYLSDYIRKAVEARNNACKVVEQFDSTHKNNEVSKEYANSNPSEGMHLTKDNAYDVLSSIYRQPKSTMVKPLTKGGGKKK
jgi:predicted ATP-grasp superfamily ATP-dependent carboligase